METIIIVLFFVIAFIAMTLFLGITFPKKLISNFMDNFESDFHDLQEKTNKKEIHIKLKKSIPLIAISILPYYFTYPGLITCISFSFFSALCLSLAFCDYQYEILPEQITVTLIISGIFFTLSGYNVIDINSSLKAGFIPVIFLWLINILSVRLMKSPVIETGDIYFIAGIGIWIGKSKLLEFGLVIAVLIMITIVFSKHKSKNIRLGIPLCMSALITTMIPSPLTSIW